jgi:hypothetical protein
VGVTEESAPIKVKYCRVTDGIVIIFGLDFADV